MADVRSDPAIGRHPGEAENTPMTDPGIPAPVFEVVAADPIGRSAVPAVRFGLRVTESSEREIFSMAVTATIHVEPSMRRYDVPTRELLEDVFGSPDRWAVTTHPLVWAKVDTNVIGFTGSTQFDVIVPLNHDMELAVTRYLFAIPDGIVPITFHLVGTVLYRGDGDRPQAVRIPWNQSPEFKLPIETWRAAIAEHHSDSSWIRLSEETMRKLMRARALTGTTSYDVFINSLLEGSGDVRPEIGEPPEKR